jgi:hypothetical protein
LGCDLTNCTVCANSGGSVGGVADSVTPPAGSIVRNSILYYNSPANWSLPAALAFTCATPLSLGTGNFSNAPRFLDAAGGDFHLATNSPCINAGSNALVHGNTDCDGYPRIAGNTVDLGAYEVQAPASLLSYAWAEQYGLDTDGSADFTDPDGDGLNNWQEWIAGTNPTNALSVLRMTSASKGVNGSLILGWQSVNTRSYFLQRATSPGSPPAFSTVQSNLAGVAGTTFYTDAAATNGGPYFYRVGVQ